MTDANEDRQLNVLLDFLKRTRNFDFSNYKRTSLERRLHRRMEIVGFTTYMDYQDFLEVHPEEFSSLFDTILINVTTFFRDPLSWNYLQEKIVPAIIASKQADDPIRVWSAGCATGEEPCTLAMILAEALGRKAYQARVKIYATDVDEDALNQARRGSYAEKDMQMVPTELRQNYFESNNGRFLFAPDLRRSMIFGRHDLFQDAPISHLDLLVCRNTLMYFNAEVQAQILPRFHFALNDHGFLFLGKAEMIYKHGALFLPEDVPNHIFTRAPNITLRDRPLTIGLVVDSNPLAANDRLEQMKKTAFELGRSAQLIVDFNGVLVSFNEQARALFGLAPKDLKRTFQELELSFRPVELGALIDQAYSERHKVMHTNVAHTPPRGEVCYLDVEVTPLQSQDGGMMGVCISYTDVTRYNDLKEDVKRSSHELEAAYEKLQSTNEELETTNEELQSAVEELETTNEELQSSNEEMETMNEELQSTIEELQTVNDEMRVRTNDLNTDNSFLQAILSSLQYGVAVLDRNLNIKIWNSNAENLWGLRSEEVQGRSFLTLDIGLPTEHLAAPFRQLLDGKLEVEEQTMKAINRRGKSFMCHLICNPLKGNDDDHPGIVISMEALEE